MKKIQRLRFINWITRGILSNFRNDRPVGVADVKLSCMHRIVSFLPSATEMVCCLGLSNSLVGITHECDYPPEVRDKPIVVRNVLPIETMTQHEIDQAVAKRMQNGQSLYQIDEQLLRQLAPDLIVTQNLCQVCAPSGNEVSQVLQCLPNAPRFFG